MKLFTISAALVLGTATLTMARVIDRDFQHFTPLIPREDQRFTPILPGSALPPSVAAQPPSAVHHPHPTVSHVPTTANNVIIGDQVFKDLKLGQCLPIQQQPPFNIENQSKYALFVTSDPKCNISGIIYPAPQGVVSLFDQGDHFLVASEELYRLPWDQ